MKIISDVFQFKLKNNKKLFMLHNNQSTLYERLTFLESDLRLATKNKYKDLIQNPSSAVIKSLEEHIRQMNKSSIYISQLQSSSSLDSEILQVEKKIPDVIKSFQNLRLSLRDNISLQQLMNVASIASFTNCLDFKLWHRILMVMLNNYSNLPQEKKYMMLMLINNFSKKFVYSTMTKQKFSYPETHLGDLCHPSYLVQTLLENFDEISDREFKRRKHLFYICDKPPTALPLEIFTLKTEIIKKISKAVDVNAYLVDKFFHKNRAKLEQNLHQANFETLLMIYEFNGTKVRTNSSDFSQKIQQQLYSKLKKNIFIAPIKKILNTWKYQTCHVNQLENLVINFSTEFLEQLTKKNILFYKQSFESLAIHLLYKKQPNFELIKKIIHKFQEFNIQQGQNIQIAKHYLALKNKNQDYNNKKWQILNEKKVKQPIEFNIAESFWFNSLKNISQVKNIQRNKYICAYQIDLLAEYKDKKFAFQVQGGHYDLRKNQASQKIRQEILKQLNILTIKISCNSPQMKIMMRLKNFKQAEAYIINQLEKAIRHSAI